MNTMYFIRTLGQKDAKLIGRDGFMLLLFGLVAYLGIVLRYGLPWLNEYLIEAGMMPGERIASSLSEYYPLIVAYFAIFQGALIGGTIFGFMLLNEKDDNTLTAMLVTPVPMERYMLYRIVAPAFFAFVMVLILVWTIGQALIPAPQLILIALGSAFTAPIGALFYGIYAENKIQGFAISKFVGLAGWIIAAGWFIDAPWHWLLSLFPPYLVSKAYWMVLDGSPWWWLALVVGIVGQIGLIYWMAKWFNRAAYR